MIVNTILAKIDAADVFVADISLINPDQSAARLVPNPNVAFETGWAAARLGSHRVILVFNETTGKIEDVPFDLRGRATLTYRFDGAPAAKKRIEEQIAAELTRRVELALQSPEPIRPRARKAGSQPVSPQQKRERDRESLYEVLGRLNTDWVDYYVDQLAMGRIPQHEETYFIMFTEIVDGARFRMFDKQTNHAIREFRDSWAELMDASRHGDAVVGTTYARFSPESYADGKEVDALRQRFHETREMFAMSYRGLVDRIHKAFPEFTLAESNQRAVDYLNSL